MNVACASPDCPRPVTGQCAGYHNNCRRFYCAEHGTDGYCAVCYEDKAVDDLLNEYYEIAESLTSRPWYKRTSSRDRSIKPVAAFLIAVVLFFLSMFTGSYVLVLLTVIITIGSMLYLWLWSVLAVFGARQDADIDGEVAEIAKDKPGFDVFYEEWAKEKNRAVLEKTAAITGVIALAGIAGAVENKREEDRVRRAVDDAFQRRGL